MASRTRIVCLHEGTKGRSIDPVFIRTVLRCLSPSWIRRWDGNNLIRTVAKAGRSSLIASLPDEIKIGRQLGSTMTLMVWADIDDKMPDGETLKNAFWARCETEGITKQEFDAVIFVFAKDRLENWIEFFIEGKTDESQEGQKVGKYSKDQQRATEAARKLAEACQSKKLMPNIPPSLSWSCSNWRNLLEKVK